MLTNSFQDTIYNLTRRFWFQAHQVEPQECGLGQKFHLCSIHFLEKFIPYNVHGLTKSQFSLWFIEDTLHFVMKQKKLSILTYIQKVFLVTIMFSRVTHTYHYKYRQYILPILVLDLRRCAKDQCTNSCFGSPCS